MIQSENETPFQSSPKTSIYGPLFVIRVVGNGRKDQNNSPHQKFITICRSLHKETKELIYINMLLQSVEPHWAIGYPIHFKQVILLTACLYLFRLSSQAKNALSNQHSSNDMITGSYIQGFLYILSRIISEKQKQLVDATYHTNELQIFNDNTFIFIAKL